MTLTPKQLKVLQFIERYTAGNGYAPTLREIGRHMRVCEVTALQYRRALERKRYLAYERYQPRSIKVLRPSQQGDGLSLKFLGYIAAGKPIEVVQEDETVDLVAMLPRPEDHFVLRVRGNSMIDEHIEDGDYVIVERRNVANNGDTVVALVDGSEVTLKKFYREGGRIRLQPANPSLPPIFPDRVDIQGVVVGVLRTYR
jgi:repressor LexA